MLIIVEGCDRTGKSSLCRAQPVHTRSRYLHFSAPKGDDPWEEYVKPLEDYVPGSGEDVWVDRHYLGELVWPRFFGRDPIMDRAQQLEIEEFLRSRGAYCVWAWRLERSLWAACLADGEDIGARALDAQHTYYGAVTESSSPWRLYVHGDPVEPIVRAARAREELARRRMLRLPRTWGPRR